ncbi:hypothetical protein B0H14DRAFT_2626376 [Mycena olivaceomarginata]|nr:hypothetical protein B0H14DRAFT_2626376 [Mycena olivaceomarginata]
MPPKPAEDTTPKAHWIEDETIALIDCGQASSRLSQQQIPRRPQRKTRPSAIPNQLKETFEMYLFVKKYSGIGWDDEDHHATATEEVIKPFLEAHGSKRAFTTGWSTKQTGEEHVVHLGNQPKKKRKSKKLRRHPIAPPQRLGQLYLPENDAANKENEIVEIDGDGNSVGAGGKGQGRFDDELVLLAQQHRASQRGGWDSDRPLSRHPLQGPRKARRHPAEDMSHVDKVVEILKDKSLLPPDPRGATSVLSLGSSQATLPSHAF